MLYSQFVNEDGEYQVVELVACWLKFDCTLELGHCELLEFVNGSTNKLLKLLFLLKSNSFPVVVSQLTVVFNLLFNELLLLLLCCLLALDRFCSHKFKARPEIELVLVS